MGPTRLFLVPGFLVCLAYPVQAGEPAKPANGRPPLFTGELAVEIQNDGFFQSDDPGAELNDLYNKSELTGGFTLSDRLSVQVHLTFEPIRDAVNDRAFDDEGLYAEELFGQYENERLRLFAGKFNPSFGTAFNKAPGIYGQDFAEDYEIAERLGLGAAVTSAPLAIGTLVVTGNAYMADTSALSDSLIASRGRTRRSDGGVSNTGSPDSFSLTVDGASIPGLEGLEYHLGYRRQKKGDGPDDLASESGFAAGLNGKRTLRSANLEWLGEIVYLDNAEGTLDELWYYTAGLALTLSRYTLAASFTGRPRELADRSSLHDRLFQISLGREVLDGWVLELAYRLAEDAGIESQAAGLKLSRSFEFGIPRR